MAQPQAIIIGGGIAGPFLALCLLKSKVPVKSTIYELRLQPSNIGGAINLTPNALRLLDYLGLLPKALSLGCTIKDMELFSIASGKRLGSMPVGFSATGEAPYDSLRIPRVALHNLLLDAAKIAGVSIQYGKKLATISETTDSITAKFTDGSSAIGGILFGCDGIHSAVRSTYVEPSRKPYYSGLSGAYGVAPVSTIKSPISFSSMGINISKSGTVLTTYSDPDKTQLFIATVVEVPEHVAEQEDNKDEGWRAGSKAKELTKEGLFQRFGSEGMPCLKEMLESVEELYFYPTYVLPNGGRYYKGRALLIGDAAHAMAPVGQSLGITFEDCVVISRLCSAILSNNSYASPPSPKGKIPWSDSIGQKELNTIFSRFTILRGPRISAAWKAAASRMEGAKESPAILQSAVEFGAWAFFSLVGKKAEKGWLFDAVSCDL